MPYTGDVPAVCRMMVAMVQQNQEALHKETMTAIDGIKTKQDELHAKIENGLSAKQAAQETAIARMRDRVDTHQKILFGGIGAILLAVLGALLWVAFHNPEAWGR